MASKVQNEFVPETLPPPGETLLETMEAVGMTQVDLARRIGRAVPYVNRIIKGLEPITPETALRLERVLGVPARFWNRLERNYREAEARREERAALEPHVDWLRDKPISVMIKAGYIQKYADKVHQLIAFLQFFGFATPQEWDAYYLSPEVSFRKSQVYESHPAATAAWLRQGELMAKEIACAPFDKSGFRKALTAIRGLTCEDPEVFEPQVRELCASVGVVVVFVPPLKGTSICGATRWLTPEKALIQLSLRGKWEDIFWFTFFHEAGHILKHGKSDTFLETGKRDDGEEEAEADRFASDTLIPPRDYRRFIDADRFTRAAIERFADEVGICPAIVVGRLKHDRHVRQDHLNDLRRRFKFKDSTG